MSKFEFKLSNEKIVQVWLEGDRIALDVDDKAQSGGTYMSIEEALRIAFALMDLAGHVEVMAKESKQ